SSLPASSSTRNTGCVLGLFRAMDPIQLLRKTYEQSSTTLALSEATLEAITSSYPSTYRPVGLGSHAYSFVAWIMPRPLMDWALNGTVEQMRGQILEMKQALRNGCATLTSTVADATTQSFHPPTLTTTTTCSSTQTTSEGLGESEKL
ncbi:hypothetical protein BGW38_010469, partial [Lunasporangiospora selenospora]